MLIEPNNIYHGDCLQIMPFIKSGSIDMILCDLPYGCTDCAWDIRLPVGGVFREYNRIIKDDGAIVLTATMKYAIELINANRKHFRYEWVWQKSMSAGFANARKMPLRKHELVLVFYKKLPTYNPQGLIPLEKPVVVTGTKRLRHESAYKINGQPQNRCTTHTNYPASILACSNGNNKNLHPTQKPVALFEYLIRTYTNESDVVLDNCIGSGTTAVAAANAGRRFIGIEQDAGYYEIARQRAREALAGK